MVLCSFCAAYEFLDLGFGSLLRPHAILRLPAIVGIMLYSIIVKLSIL